MKTKLLILMATLLSGCQNSMNPSTNGPTGSNFYDVGAYALREWEPSGTYTIVWVGRTGFEDYPGTMEGLNGKLARALQARGLRPAPDLAHTDWAVMCLVSKSKVAEYGGSLLQRCKLDISCGSPPQIQIIWRVEVDVNGAYEKPREWVNRAMDLAVPFLGTNAVRSGQR